MTNEIPRHIHHFYILNRTKSFSLDSCSSPSGKKSQWQLPWDVAIAGQERLDNIPVYLKL